jgi:formylglycine-generating enzyme required for sulfatase activity
MLEKTQQQLEEIQKARETEQQQLAQLQSEKAALQQKFENTQRQFYFSQKLRKKVNTKEAQSGDIIRDRLQENRYAPEMVWLPAGRFRMGTFHERGNEQPVHWVSIKSVAMGRYEVTFAEYDDFAEKTGRKKPSDEGWGRDNRPVINVSWEDAMAYATWLTQQTGQTYRLPTEAEWEYAARAGSVTQYWWGNEIGSNLARCKGCSNQWEQKTVPVGSFGANPFGLHDMGGNVREWTCSEYEEKYNGKEQHCHSSKQGNYRVERGGSWLNKPWSVRVTARIGNPPTGRYTNVGFRLVKQ